MSFSVVPLSRPPFVCFAMLPGVGISLTIELLQIYIPTRDPSLTDLTCNIFGTVLGVSFSNCIRIFKKQTDA